MEPEVISVCPVCAAQTTTLLRPYKGQNAIFDDLNLAQCGECSLVFADPMPMVEELAQYNSSYAENAHGGVDTNFEAINFFSGIASLRLEHILSYADAFGAAAPASVLEVGPGNGFLCQHMRARNPSCTYWVIESDPGFYDHLRELGAEICGDLADLQIGEGSIELLIMSHVLEHSADPVEFLSAVLPLMASGGIIFIELPCADYLFKEQDEPHLQFFDKPSIGKMLDRLGLCDIELSYHGKEIDRVLRQGSLRTRTFNKGRMLLRRIGIDLYRRPPSIENAHIWAAIRDHEAHLEKNRPSWWLRALARTGG